MEEAKLQLPSHTDYELCALFVDYREWLDSPTVAPTRQSTREKYEGYLRSILSELGRRHGFQAEEGEKALIVERNGGDGKPYFEDLTEARIQIYRESFETLIAHCDEVLDENREEK